MSMLVGGTFRGVVKAWKQVVSSDACLLGAGSLLLNSMADMLGFHG